MEKVTKIEGFSSLSENSMQGCLPKMTNSEILFTGKGNILYCEENVSLVNTKIRFSGNNSVVYLSKSRHGYYLNANVFNNSIMYFGIENYFNPYGASMNLVLSEGKNILIGNDNLFSFGITLRLADPHLIYSIETKKRINQSKSIFIGDHVWIGQNATILKGTQLGSGSILGAESLIANKTVASNTCCVGNPAKQVKEGVFYTSDCVHTWGENETKRHETNNTDNFIYNFKDGETKSFATIDRELEEMKESDEKLGYLIENIRKDTKKNRFYIANKKKLNKSFFGSVIQKIKG